MIRLTSKVLFLLFPFASLATPAQAATCAIASEICALSNVRTDLDIADFDSPLVVDSKNGCLVYDGKSRYRYLSVVSCEAYNQDWPSAILGKPMLVGEDLVISTFKKSGSDSETRLVTLDAPTGQIVGSSDLPYAQVSLKYQNGKVFGVAHSGGRQAAESVALWVKDIENPSNLYSSKLTQPGGVMDVNDEWVAFFQNASIHGGGSLYVKRWVEETSLKVTDVTNLRKADVSLADSQLRLKLPGRELRFDLTDQARQISSKVEPPKSESASYDVTSEALPSPVDDASDHEATTERTPAKEQIPPSQPTGEEKRSSRWPLYAVIGLVVAAVVAFFVLRKRRK